MEGKDPKEKKYKSVLEYILVEDLEGDKQGAEKILRERFENLGEGVRKDLELIYRRSIEQRGGEAISKFEAYPVLAKSSSGDPDEGVFLVGQIGEKNKVYLQVVGFDHSGYEEFFYLVEDDPFYHPTY